MPVEDYAHDVCYIDHASQTAICTHLQCSMHDENPSPEDELWGVGMLNKTRMIPVAMESRHPSEGPDRTNLSKSVLQ